MIHIRLYFDRDKAKQGLPWALRFTRGMGYEVHTASTVEIAVPTWTEIDHTLAPPQHYFIACKGELHWVGTKAIITAPAKKEVA